MEEKKHSGVSRFLIVMASICSMILCGFFLLFVVNRFSLVVQLHGDAVLEHPFGERYVDPGAEVKLAGSLFFREGIPVPGDMNSGITVDVNAPGEYQVRYDASFYCWKCSSIRTVIISDSQAPTITLVSVPGSFTIPGESYQEEGFSAQDDCDGDVTHKVQRTERDGIVIYTVTDRAGNITSVTRKIRYVDPVPPQLTLLGDAAVYMQAGSQYKEPGVTALDNCDGDISQRVEINGVVDRYLAGTYTLTYTARDAAGNEAAVNRTVVVQGKPYAETVRPSGDVIYLTFDDGPGPYTKELLELLDKYNAKATFFVVDSEYIGLVKDMVEAGHSVGIHSMSHEYKEIYASKDAYFADILGMQEIIYEQCGVRTYLMRFPGGSSNTVSRFNPGIMTYLTQAVQDCGFRYFDWNVDSNDAGGAKNAQEVFENVKDGVSARRISIVLQHDIKGFSVDAVEKILIWGLENGYQFLALAMDSPTAHHGVNN